MHSVLYFLFRLAGRAMSLLRKGWPIIREALAHVVVVGVLVLYVVVEVCSFTPAYAEVDPDGYLVLAKRMAEHQPLGQKAKNLFQYQTHVWVENSRGEVAAKFAPGYPALMSVAYRRWGDEGMFYVSPFFGALALLGMWWLFRQWGMGPLAALFALATLGLSRMYMFYTGYLLTHAVSVCFVTWGMCFLWKWLRAPQAWWGAAAGLALGFSVTVRHTNAVLALALVIAVASRLIQDRRSVLSHWRGVAALLLAYAVFPLFLCAYDKALFGAVFRTGYSLSGEQFAFSLSQFMHNLPIVTEGLCVRVLPPVLGLGLVGMVLLGDRTERLLRLAWFGTFFVVYVSYYWVTSEWSYLRFFICTLPMLVGCAYMLVAKANVSGFLRFVAMLLLCGVFFAVDHGGLDRGLRGELFGNNAHELARAGRALSQTLKPNATVFTFSPFHQYVGTRRHFELYDLAVFTKGNVNQFRPGGWPGESEPRRQPVRTERFSKFYEAVSADDLLRAKQDLVRSVLKDRRQVAYLIPKGSMYGEKAALGEGIEFKLLKEWEVPWDYWGHVRRQQWALYEVTMKAEAAQ